MTRASKKLLRNKRVAKTRRQRGYAWEYTLVKRFKGLEDWHGIRLGSPSDGLPDILAINNRDRIIYTIEAKSGTGTTLRVPHDQVAMCLRWVNMFAVYETREVILAFKFLSKKRIGVGKYESRELREFFKVWDTRADPIDCVCTYGGDTYAVREGRRQELLLSDHQMPF